jgi:hypothetical protein
MPPCRYTGRLRKARLSSCVPATPTNVVVRPMTAGSMPVLGCLFSRRLWPWPCRVGPQYAARSTHRSGHGSTWNILGRVEKARPGSSLPRFSLSVSMSWEDGPYPPPAKRTKTNDSDKAPVMNIVRNPSFALAATSAETTAFRAAMRAASWCESANPFLLFRRGRARRPLLALVPLPSCISLVFPSRQACTPTFDLRPSDPRPGSTMPLYSAQMASRSAVTNSSSSGASSSRQCSPPGCWRPKTA